MTRNLDSLTDLNSIACKLKNLNDHNNDHNSLLTKILTCFQYAQK